MSTLWARPYSHGPGGWESGVGGGLNVLSRSWAALDCTDVWDTHIPPMVHESESRVSDTSSVCILTGSGGSMAEEASNCARQR